MKTIEAELHNFRLCDPEWTPDCTCGCNGDEDCHCFDPDPDLDEAPNPDHDEDGPIWQEDPKWDDDLVALFDENQGLTAEGYAVLAEMDAMGDFI